MPDSGKSVPKYNIAADSLIIESEEDDSSDDEMYTPYEKWQNDKFDKWGARKKLLLRGLKRDSTMLDSLRKIKKGFTDNEEEVMVSPGKSRDQWKVVCERAFPFRKDEYESV